ncbi:MAG: TetR/AcrR family transcriptional regulator [Lachnospiraceae bacterium]|nr:TetR/AcrR family transcriptional regulator [Lachnospiraceae bacterium]
MKQENDYQKRELLLEAARAEFMEKGYHNASLRSICSKAGVTTGALYYFFENKEDLFAAIADPPIMELRRILSEHFKEDAEKLAQTGFIEKKENDHNDISDLLVEHIYDHYDSIMLVLTASGDTKYENIVDEFVRLVEEAMPAIMTVLPGYTYDEYLSHWMSHISIDAFIQVIIHEKDKEKARIMLRKIMDYLVKGWIELVMVKTEE